MNQADKTDTSEIRSAAQKSKRAVAKTDAVVALPDDLELRIEAAMMSTDRPLTSIRLAQINGDVPTKAIHESIKHLNDLYEQMNRSFRIEQLAGGWQIMTLSTYAEMLSSLHKTQAQSRLSAAAIETLAIIAYKQPILRAQIETIRGVACGEVIRNLMERHLVKIAGRADELGRPILYGTTKQFLGLFGLSSVKDLPKVEELRANV